METSADKPLIIIPANYDISQLTFIMGLRVKPAMTGVGEGERRDVKLLFLEAPAKNN
jgi:hypothetical protein